MGISKEDIKHVANLARLEVKPEEMDKLAKDMDNMVNMISKLQDLDLSNVDLALLGERNVLREDEIAKSLDREKVIANAPTKEAGCFSVPKIVE